MPYAYDVDLGSCDAKGSEEKLRLAGQIRGSRVGILTRIDVFTPDPRRVIAGVKRGGHWGQT